MIRADLAWRGFVTPDLEVIAWPTMLSDHANFHSTFYTTDDDFVARWRQWSPGGEVDFDPGAPVDAQEAVHHFLNGNGRR